MKKLFVTSYLLFAFCCFLTTHRSPLKAEEKSNQANPPIYIAFLWHMHQPIYWPYETVNQTDQNNRYSYSVTDIHNQRIGPYTTWPKNAVQAGINAGLQHLGAQVSFSGSLIENLNNLEAGGNGNFSNWKSSWNQIKQQNTSLGNPRLDMVGFGYHHPLMGLIDYLDTRKQIQSHKQIMSANFPGSYSKGIFPPENAFAPKMIPALVAEGIEWVLVDNVHFDRACNNYPFSTSGNLYEPNKADVLNPNPNDWVQLNGLWAPTRNSAKWGRQPHYVEYVDPTTGTSTKIIAVPADRYMGNEDGRGGFGALNYENVMSQLESYNTDPSHPILIVLHHDGDNYGGGSDSYYNSNFSNFVNWLTANPTRFVGTTVQDYLEMFPPSTSDVIHIENGSWSGADNGDPEFKKWLGDPDGSSYSPDRNSWGVVTAAKNFVMTAEQINSGSSNTTNAWKYMLNGEASDYWYWDGSQNGIWDSHPTRAVNQAVTYAQSVVNSGSDLTGPTIFQPQREPYNPGATEWGINQPSDMTVWTYVFDVHGLKSVKLKYRTDIDGVNSTSSNQNETYAGGSEVNAWVELNMTGVAKSSTTNPSPLYKAKEFSSQITGLNNVLLDYYVEAVDSFNNVSKSVISHVWIGQNSGGGGGGGSGVSWSPVNPTNNDTITITVSGAAQGAKLHWGVNNVGSSWQTPNSVYRPAGSTLFNGTGPAVESPMSGPDTASKLTIKLGPFNNVAQAVSKIAFVIHYNDGTTWDNNSGQDYHIELPDTSQPNQTFTMDGQLDASAQSVATNAGLNLYLGWNNTELYVATQSAQSQGGDMFIFVSDSQQALTPSPWVKAGNVAAWDAVLANESSNNYVEWRDNSGTTAKSAGTILEGTLNIQQEFGNIPAKLYIAVGKYQTADGGSLTAQVPVGNGNGNIESNELYEFDYTFSGVTPPAAPNLSSPSNGLTNQSTTLNLQWNASSGATLYHVALSTDSTFASSIVMDSNISATSKQVSSLLYITKYYWRARAKNAGGWGSWSSVWNFTTMEQPQAPSAPMLSSPVNDATNQPLTLSLQWNSSSGATQYHVRVSTDSTFASTIVNDSIVNSTIKNISSLSINRKYFWKVRAKNSVGWSSWSDVWSFTTGNPYSRVSIHDIQFIPDSLLTCLDAGGCSASSQYSQYYGDTVTVTALCIVEPRIMDKLSGGFSLVVSDTSSSSSWNGALVIASTTDTTKLISDGFLEIKTGNIIEMVCIVSEYIVGNIYSNTRLIPLAGNSITIMGSKNLPLPRETDAAEFQTFLDGEELEGLYTQLTHLTVVGWINPTERTFAAVDEFGNIVATQNPTNNPDISLPAINSLIDTLRGIVYARSFSSTPQSTKYRIATISPKDIVYASHFMAPTSLNFSYVQIDSSRSSTFSFYNQQESGDITIESVVSTNPAFTASPETTTVPAQSSKLFTVTFTPNDTGSFSGYIIVSHSASVQPESVSVSGMGVTDAPIEENIQVVRGWNLVSLPLFVDNDSASQVFPYAVTLPFAFDNLTGYYSTDRIENGNGYWLKFDSAETVSVSGFPRVADTIDVKVGWNLIGTISESVAMDFVTSIPAGIISSSFFGYDLGYVSPTTLEPGKGYWVKVSQDGKLILLTLSRMSNSHPTE